MNSIEQNTQLLMYRPMNVIVFVIFYAPVIVALGVLGMSFIFQNLKGYIYLGFLLASCILREFALSVTGAKLPQASLNSICDAVQYSRYGNSTFSIFCLTFTLFYICMPMFLNKDINYCIFGGLLAYLLATIGILFMKRCVTNVSDVIVNLIFGGALGVIIPVLLYAGGSSKYLFFNEVSSNKEVCSMPKKQQFKCAVYKNGELVKSTTN